MSGQWSFPPAGPPSQGYQPHQGSNQWMHNNQQQQHFIPPPSHGSGPPFPSPSISMGPPYNTVGGANMYQPHPPMGMSGNMYYQQQPHPHGMVSMATMTLPTQARMTAEQQQRMMAEQYRLQEEQRKREIEEQRRREMEEQKRRDIELQRRRLQTVNITNPSLNSDRKGTSTLQSLIGFELTNTGTKPVKHTVTMATTTSSITPSFTNPVSLTVTNSTTSINTGSTATSNNPVSATNTTGRVSPVAAPSISPSFPVNTNSPIISRTVNTGPSLDQLLVNTMTSLDSKGGLINKPLTKNDFKSPVKSSPQIIAKKPQQQPLHFSSSTKARDWQGQDFSGLFETKPHPPEGEEDGFGDFHSSALTQQEIKQEAPSLPLQMTTPTTPSPQLVHSQPIGHAPVMSTGLETILPSWLISSTVYSTVHLPPLYYTVYKYCAIEGSELTNTSLLFPLLMSSDLDRSILRTLWEIVNHTVPGQLTKIELYALLGLIGLAQIKGGQTVTLADLKTTVAPPIPHLPAVTDISNQSSQGEDEFGDFQSTVSDTKVAPSNKALPLSNQTPSLDNQSLDDPYAAFKTIAAPSQTPPLRNQTPPLSNQSLDDPYTAFKTIAAPSQTPPLSTHAPPLSNQAPPLDNQSLDGPYVAFKTIAAPSQTPPLSNQTPPLSNQSSNDPYAAFKTIAAPSQTPPLSNQAPLLDNQSLDDPYAAFKTIAAPSQTPPLSNQTPPLSNQSLDDPYSAFKTIAAPSQTPPLSNEAPPFSNQAPLDNQSLADPFAAFKTTAAPSQTPPLSTHAPPLSNQAPPLDNQSLDDPYAAFKTIAIPSQTPPLSNEVLLLSTQSPPLSNQAPPLDNQLLDDPYAAFKTIAEPSQTSSLSNQSLDDPYSAFKTIAASSQTPLLSNEAPPFSNQAPHDNQSLDDPFGAFKTTAAPSQTSLLSNHTLPLSNKAPPLDNQSLGDDGWADFTSSGFVSQTEVGSKEREEKEDEHFTEFATYSQPIVTMSYIHTSPPPLSPSPPPLSTSLPPLSTVPPPLSTSPPPLSPTSSIDSLTNTKVALCDAWNDCLLKCKDLLEECLSVLSAEDQSILVEITKVQEGRLKLTEIAQVYSFAKRLHTTSRGAGKKLMSPSKNESLTVLMLSIKNTWTELCALFPSDEMSQFTPSSLSSSLSSQDETHDKCSLCLQPSNIFISPLVTIDGSSEDYSLMMTQVEGKTCHIQCANFWKVALGRDISLIP